MGVANVLSPDPVVGGGVLVSMVASGELAGLDAGATVSVFCSQAASKAAPARRQMYFFINTISVNHDSEQARSAAVTISG